MGDPIFCCVFPTGLVFEAYRGFKFVDGVLDPICNTPDFTHR